MTAVNIYLTFNGNCESAFNYYKSVFGGEYNYISRFKDMPPTDGRTIGGSDGERIMHVSLPISTETSLMGSDILEESGAKFITGNNFSVSVSTDEKDKADRMFKQLSSGGNIIVPMNNTFWGSYFGMLTDKFGINWMISCDEKPVTKSTGAKEQSSLA